MNDDIHSLVSHWLEDKAGREAFVKVFESKCKDGTISPQDQQVQLLKMLAEDVLVLRWFVEKLLYETRDKHARNTGASN